MRGWVDPTSAATGVVAEVASLRAHSDLDRGERQLQPVVRLCHGTSRCRAVRCIRGLLRSRCFVSRISPWKLRSKTTPTYSGGFGALAGDTLRSAADLDVPLVAVTLVSHAGYVEQELDQAGRRLDSADPWEPSQYASPASGHGGGPHRRAGHLDPRVALRHTRTHGWRTAGQTRPLLVFDLAAGSTSGPTGSRLGGNSRNGATPADSLLPRA